MNIYQDEKQNSGKKKRNRNKKKNKQNETSL